MTTPPVTTGSWEGVLAPPDVAALINMLVGGSPFAASLTKYPTTRAEVAFPVAAPDRPAWTGEGGTIPTIGLNDAADIVAVKKLAELLRMSNESIADTSVNLTAQVADLLRDSSGPELDRGLLYGSLPTEPKGVIPNVQAVDGTDLAGAITTAIGVIGNAGGTATTIAAKPSLFAEQRNVKATGSGEFLYPLGLGAQFGLAEVGVPELADCLVYDRTRLFLIARTTDFAVDMSQDYFFDSDSAAIRVRGRFAVGMPVPLKAARKITVAGVAPTGLPGTARESHGGKR
jgi:HK97 family phage major capsid protein